jgi:2-amino-4-hydroxy-6-hydroxymethyldihydropteridine diphosphokinase
VALSLGSNLGDREDNISQMEKRLCRILIPPFRMSSLMETEPVDVKERQSSYLNRIFCGGFSKSAEHLLEQCFQIEYELGRTDKGAKLARTADIDIILFGDLKISDEKLTIPHPQLFSRRFCIEGLCEIVPEWRVPGTGFTIMELYGTIWNAVKDQKIEKLTA